MYNFAPGGQLVQNVAELTQLSQLESQDSQMLSFAYVFGGQEVESTHEFPERNKLPEQEVQVEDEVEQVTHGDEHAGQEDGVWA